MFHDHIIVVNINSDGIKILSQMVQVQHINQGQETSFLGPLLLLWKCAVTILSQLQWKHFFLFSPTLK